jgi:hypothetical protein
MGLRAWLNLERKDIYAFAISGLLGVLAVRLVPNPNFTVFIYLLVSYHLFLAWLLITGEKKPGFSFKLLPAILTHLVCLALVIGLGAARSYIPFFAIVRYAVAAIAVLERRQLFKTVGSSLTPEALGSIALAPAEARQGVAPVQAQAQVDAPAVSGYASLLPQTENTVPRYRPEPVAPAPQAPQPAARPAYGSIAFSQSQSGVPMYRPETAATATAVAEAPVQTQIIAPAAQTKGKAAKGKAPEPQINPILTATGEDHEDWLRHLARRNPTHRRAGSSISEEYHDWLLARSKARAADEAAGLPRHA